jgi:ribonucleoside-diphosphate reductase beta chain
MTSAHHTALTTVATGLQRDTPPMRLYEKAKRYGIWNPSELDLTQDRQDWLKLQPAEQEVILHLTALFQGGEEAVTLDLLPLIMTIAREGRIEEEIYLTTFLFEEAKHTDFFRRFLDEVAGKPGDLSRFHTDNYRALFYQALPTALDALLHDSSPQAQVIASVTYNMIVEGVLAETGYHAYYTMLRNNKLMPGTTQGIDLLKQDESRHIAYGIFLLSRLIAADPGLWPIAQNTMNMLLMQAMAVINEIFERYDPMPFGLKLDDFIQYAMMQYQKRYARLEKAVGASLEDVYRVTQAAIETNDA